MSEDKLVLDDGPPEAPAQEQNGNAPVQQPAEAAPAPAQGKTEREDKVAKGTQFVDFDQIPDKQLATAIESRFKRVYWNVKNLENQVRSADEERARMFEINKQMAEELASLRRAQEDKSAGDAVTVLKGRIQQALAVADYATATDLTEQLAEAKAAQKMRPERRIEVPEPQQPEAPVMNLSAAEQRTLVSWQSHVDDSGQPVRPWANPAHPQFQKTLGIISAVMKDPEFEGAGLAQILGQVDQLMGGGRQQPRTAAFPTSDPAIAGSVQRATPLSDQEKRVAEAMFLRSGIPGLAKTAEEAHNMYRKNKKGGGVRNVATFDD